MDSEASVSNLVIVRKKQRLRMFLTIYWKTFFIIAVFLLLLPITCIKKGNAYKSFYVFLVTAVLWMTDVLHPVAVSMFPVCLGTLFGAFGFSTMYQIQVRTIMLNCLGAMILVQAIEYSQLHKRVAVKILLTFGCSHYRLSFIIFFSSMFLAMWISSTLTCGLIMPTMKAVLNELERMGVIEVYQIIGKENQKRLRHEQSILRPTRFTIFYFLGIAYSVSIGELSTFIGSETNQIFRIYCEIIFPQGPRIEFPQFLLLNLPSVVIIETLVYLWLNFYFLGMFRKPSAVELHTSISEDEARYIRTLLALQYDELGTIRYHEIVVAASLLLTAILQATICYPTIDQDFSAFQRHITIATPSLLSVVLLFLIPIDLKFTKFFKKSDVLSGEPLPSAPSKACMSWGIIRDNVDWSVLFIIGGSMSVFEALKDSGMTTEFENFLASFTGWPAAALLLIIMIFCKIMSEFTCSPCVVYCLLPHIAKVSVQARVNPHYLMVGCTLSCSLPFHLVTGTPVNTMVASYVHISHLEIIKAGVGPTLISLCVIWFAVTLWAKAIWTDINADPAWAYINVFHPNLETNKL